MGIRFIVIIFISIFSFRLEDKYFKLLEFSLDDDLVFLKKRRNKKINIFFILLFNITYIIICPRMEYPILCFVLFQIFILTSLSDLWMYAVSNKLIYTLSFILILISYIYKFDIKNNLLEAVKMLVFMYIVYLMSMGGIGGADVRIYTIVSYIYGFKSAIYILIISAWLSLFYIMYMKVFNKKIKNKIPYIPFISLATLSYMIERI